MLDAIVRASHDGCQKPTSQQANKPTSNNKAAYKDPVETQRQIHARLAFCTLSDRQIGLFGNLDARWTFQKHTKRIIASESDARIACLLGSLTLARSLALSLGRLSCVRARVSE